MSTDLNCNIASHLVQQAQNNPFNIAVIVPHGRDRKSGKVSYVHYTYQQLDNASNRIATTLSNNGIKSGQRCVLMVSPGLDFFALTFALFKMGAIPILIDPGMGIKNIKTCLEEAQPEIFIGISKAHIARIILGWGKPSLQKNITTGKLPLPGTANLAKLLESTELSVDFPLYQPALVTTADTTLETASNTTMAAILFTSGSTGVPKGVVYTHTNFNAQIDALQQLYNIQPGEKDLCTFPLFALFAPALGMTSIIPDMDATKPAQVDPQLIFEAIDDFGITNMFGSPALLRRVANAGVAQKRKLPTLKRVISAGAPVPATTLQQCSSLLNNDDAPQIFTPYGATEALPVCSISSNTILQQTAKLTDEGAGICVGKPAPNIDLKIIKIDDKAFNNWDNNLEVSDNSIGEICVRGPQVTAKYFNRQPSTALAKISTDDGGFYHRMGDVGYRDGDGKIWFCGRKSHRVVTATETMFTIPSEAVFNIHPLVYRTALVGLGAPGKQTPVLCVELLKKTDQQSQQKIISELRQIQQRFAHTQAITEFLFHPAFPVDIRHNAKIFREKLAVWAQKKVTKTAGKNKS